LPESGGGSRLVRDVVNARAFNGATALHVAASLKMEPQQRTRVIHLLLTNAAEFSARSDSKLRVELAKDPAVCNWIFNTYLQPLLTVE